MTNTQLVARAGTVHWQEIGIENRKHISLRRMHSSRMGTGRSLTVCRSLLPAGGGCLLRGGVSAPGGVCSGGVCSEEVSTLGGVCSGGCLLWGVSAPWGVCSGGCLLQGVSAPGGCLFLVVSALGGVSTLGGVCSRGVSAPGVCGIPACTEAATPPPCKHNFVAAGNKIRKIEFPQCRGFLLFLHTPRHHRYFWTVPSFPLYTNEVFVNNPELTFLTFLYKIDIDVLSRHVLNRRFFKLNFVSCTTSLFGFGSFLDSIEHDFIRI